MINQNINDVKVCLEQLDTLSQRLMESIHADARALTEVMRSNAGMRMEASSALWHIEDALDIKARSFSLGGKQAFYARVSKPPPSDAKDMAERMAHVVEQSLMQGL